jgi:hypothetical protein
VRNVYADSWMSPDAAKSRDLLYITDALAGDVYAVALPSGKVVGKLTGFNQPLGDCADKDGDVLIALSQQFQVRAFKHGARQPYNVLADPGYYPSACSVDPTTGNLAVANIIGDGNSPDPGNVAIYTKARGAPAYYSDPDIYQYSWVAYDDRGNLFVDGTSTPPNDAPELAGLPKGSKQFKRLTVSPGSDAAVYALDWDGRYLAAGGASGQIVEFEIKGNKARVVDTTVLKGESTVLGFWIDGSSLYASVIQSSVGAVGLYSYPSGGTAKAYYYAAPDPWGVTLSIKPT